MDYHVFKKPKIKNGKKIYKWYYYYTQNGKQIQKACKNCNNRSDAESYIRSLPPLQNKSASITVKDIAQTMFLTGSDHVSRRSQLGLSVLLETLQISRGYVERIIEKWGTYDIRTLSPKDTIRHLVKTHDFEKTPTITPKV